MRKVIIAVSGVGIGALALAAYNFYGYGFIKKEVPATNNTQANVIRSQPIPANLYHEGIDTFFIVNNDTFLLKDLSSVFSFIVAQTDSQAHSHEHGNNYEFWRYYLTQPHPNIGTIKKYFTEAAAEFKVPVEILYAIGQIENNWTQIGPSIDQGWGIMHLVDNHYCTTLSEAAHELKLPQQILKDNAKENIRGGAALLAKYAGDDRTEFKSFEEWYPAMKKFSGLINDEIQEIQLAEYTRVLYHGSKSVTLWGEEILLLPQPKIYRK